MGENRNPNLDEEGRFRSSKHTDLPPDRVRLNVARPENWPGLLLVADAYRESDPDFSAAIKARIGILKAEAKGKAERCCLMNADHEQCGNTGEWILRDQDEPYDTYTYACHGHLAGMMSPGVTLVWPAEMGP